VDDYLDGVDIPFTDYPKVSDLLTNYVGTDFTFIRPGVPKMRNLSISDRSGSWINNMSVAVYYGLIII
jgi:hypothetical protein